MTPRKPHSDTGTLDGVDERIVQPKRGDRVEFHSERGVQRGIVHELTRVNLEPNSQAEPTTPACVVVWTDGELSGPIPTEHLTIV